MVRDIYTRLGKTGRWAVVIGLVAAVMLAGWLFSLVSAALLPSGDAASASKDAKDRLAELQAKYTQQIAQFDGRTVFYVPAPPQAAEAATDEAPVDPDAPAPPPEKYGGPAIIATVNDVLWFNDGARIKVGDKSGDVKVVSLRSPWDATLEWKGKEFKVPFFEKDSVVLGKSSGASSNIPSPPAESPASTDAAAAAASAAKPAEAAGEGATKPPAAPDPATPGTKPESPPDNGGTPPPPPPEPPPGTPPQPPPQSEPQPESQPEPQPQPEPKTSAGERTR